MPRDGVANPALELDYFTCTLGEAALHGKTDPSPKDINGFIEQLAQRSPDRPAAGFYTPSTSADGSWHTEILNFEDIRRGSTVVADILSRASTHGLSSSATVALLCSSTADFLFTWLGLLRLGHRVLLLAPQLAPPAIAHLCRQCEVRSLLHDGQYQDLARGTGKHMAAEEGSEFWIFDIETVMGNHGVFETIKHEPDCTPDMPKTQPHDVAFYFHTSGTSTGLPKPIPQSHFAAVGALPRLDGAGLATFTTTPLYHGGISDLFRAWSSDAMLWLFPGKGVPITAANIVRCLNLSKEASSLGQSPPIHFFSGVPYVLQMMEQERQGLLQLQEMATVGVGGAALPDEVGNRLVKQGVNLISRFGSAECGFLLSSRREYRHDRHWQYLRDHTQSLAETRSATTTNGHGPTDHSRTRAVANEDPTPVLRFEARENGLAELVVLPTWPHRARTNRPDGSYATSDLFEPHESIPNAWRYHSRADGQLTLITGKKFDPAPLEAAIAASSPFVSDVFIFGDGKPYPGALIFKSTDASARSHAEVLEHVWPAVDRLNREGQAHTRLSRQMITVKQCDLEGLDKSSKGTTIRSKATERFAHEIDSAYERVDGIEEDVADEDVVQYILDSVRLIHGESSSKRLTKHTDLHDFGFDSIASIQLRSRLNRLLPAGGDDLPLSVVEDRGSVRRLAEYIIMRRHGKAIDDMDDEEQLMRELLEKYGRFETVGTADGAAIGNGELVDNAPEVVVLTGATGALGSHVLHLYQQRPEVSKIYCLVRGADAHAAKERVRTALLQRGLPDLVSFSSTSEPRVEVLQCELSEEQLGLSQEDYRHIADTATVFVHLAWAVNFRLNLHHFEREHIAGTHNLLNLARSARQRHPDRLGPTFLFCSSTASCTGLLRQLNTPRDEKSLPNHTVMAGSGSTGPSKTIHVPEQILKAPSAASELGYGRSKWVAEAIVDRSASSGGEASEGLRRVAVLRVGQLSGDTKRGIWNTSEAWPIMLKSVKDTKALPALKDQSLDWLPVDIAAQAVIEIGQAMKRSDGDCVDGARVFHVLNPHRKPSWMDMLRWLEEKETFEVLEPKRWIEKLEAVAEKHPNQPALKLLGLWKDTYDGSDVNPSGSLSFELSRTQATVPVLSDVQPLDQTYFRRVWKWLEEQRSQI